MEDSRRLDLSLKTLMATIFLGVAGDLLLRDAPWGIGFAIYGFVVLAVALYIHRKHPVAIAKDALVLVPLALLFTSLFAWRDSDDLKLLNGLCFALLIGALALRVRKGDIGVATLVDYPLRLIGRWVGFLADFVCLAGLEGQSKHFRKAGLGKRLAAWTRGALIAAPLLLVFAVLFASSDAVFDHFAQKAVSIDEGTVASHIFVFACCMWLVGGLLRRMGLGEEPADRIGPPEPGPRLGITEITIVLGALNALFLSFVAIQCRYLFGGKDLVMRTAHLSYSQYAHQGFFELVLAAVLGLGVVVAAHSILQEEGRRDWRAFAGLAAGLVALIFVVMASAMMRMGLYVVAYGITRERLYAVAVLFWLAMVLAWFCATTLRRHPDRFAAGAFASLLLIVAGLNCLNPDAFIAQINTSESLHRIDGAYLATLSDDADPVLAGALPHLPADARAVVGASLKARRQSMESEDWRSWNLDTTWADRALRSARQ